MRKASRLRLARITRGMTQGELGQKIGRGQTMVSHFETGRIRVSTKDAKKIARVLKTSEDVLFG